MIQTEIKSKQGEDICIGIYPDNCKWHYLVDCGEASLLNVRDCLDLKALFISHTHIDHFINFDQIMRHHVGSEKKYIICGPLNIALQVQAKLRSFTWNLIQENDFSYEIREIVSENCIYKYEIKPSTWEIVFVEELNELYTDERIEVHFKILDHKIPVIAYLFKENDTVNIDITKCSFAPGKWINNLKIAFKNDEKKAIIEIDKHAIVAAELFHLLTISRGQSLGVIMDHAANPENHQKIKELFCECDTVLIETFYKDEDKEKALLNFHSYAAESGRVMREAKVKNAIPIHFSRKYLDEDIKEIIQNFEKSFNGK